MLRPPCAWGASGHAHPVPQATPPTGPPVPGTPPAELAAWRKWVARTFDVPVFLLLPQRIFNSPNDLKLFEALLRRKNLLPAEAGAPAAA